MSGVIVLVGGRGCGRFFAVVAVGGRSTCSGGCISRCRRLLFCCCTGSSRCIGSSSRSITCRRHRGAKKETQVEGAGTRVAEAVLSVVVVSSDGGNGRCWRRCCLLL